MIPLAFVRAALEATPGAEITTFRAGHAAFLEQPDAFVQGFIDFVDRRLAPGESKRSVPRAAA